MPRGSLFIKPAPRIAPVAFGTIANAAGVIDPADAGMLVGDLLMVNCPHETASNPMTLSGGSWTETAYTWYPTLNYAARFAWKVLADLNEIDVLLANYGAVYAAYRGPTVAAIVVNDDALVTTSHTLAFPSKDSACIGLVGFGQEQAGGCNLNAPTDWADRFHAFMLSVFAMDILDNFSPPSGAHSPEFTGTATGAHCMLGVELRTA